MRLNPNYHVLVQNGSQKMIDSLSYLQYDLEQSELNIAAYIVLIDQLDEFKNLLTRAVPDWRIETRQDFADRYEDEVQLIG